MIIIQAARPVDYETKSYKIIVEFHTNNLLDPLVLGIEL